MKKIYIIGFGGILFSLTLILFGEPFLVLGTLGAFLVYVGIPAGLLAFALLLIKRIPARGPLIVLYGVGGWVAFFIFTAFGTFASVKWTEASAKAFPSKISPQFEAYRKLHGRYPATLAALPQPPSVPKLLRPDGYHSTGTEFTFVLAGTPPSLVVRGSTAVMTGGGPGSKKIKLGSSLPGLSGMELHSGDARTHSPPFR